MRKIKDHLSCHELLRQIVRYEELVSKEKQDIENMKNICIGIGVGGTAVMIVLQTHYSERFGMVPVIAAVALYNLYIRHLSNNGKAAKLERELLSFTESEQEKQKIRQSLFSISSLGKRVDDIKKDIEKLY
ncbi:hypothetical protein [Vibrio sp. Vb0587]|uniref:hypothetical protein n=1 Tax=Vibrio sp. Vb0587 TaxID=3074626 RepID=UPI002964C5E7|nr:hypothetical protein [Vibrio sp. Vb0587]MDW1964072.1 hypothetical protein [Vibrio sp. Vb0587]